MKSLTIALLGVCGVLGVATTSAAKAAEVAGCEQGTACFRKCHVGIHQILADGRFRYDGKLENCYAQWAPYNLAARAAGWTQWPKPSVRNAQARMP